MEHIYYIISSKGSGFTEEEGAEATYDPKMMDDFMEMVYSGQRRTAAHRNTQQA